MSAGVVERSREGGVVTLRVNRPAVLNALNAEVIAGLRAEIAAAVADEAVRCLVLTGSGEKAFVAGADISQFVTATPVTAERLALATKALHDDIAACPRPVIAAVNGLCLGAGLELALACDIRLAAATARFGLPEIRLGIMPGGGGTARLSRIAGAGAARALALSGESIDAERALALGIVSAVHPAAALAGAAADLAARLAGFSPLALAQLKSTLDTVASGDLESACRAEIKAFALCFATEDQKEGARAFLEKRPPVFTGR